MTIRSTNRLSGIESSYDLLKMHLMPDGGFVMTTDSAKTEDGKVVDMSLDSARIDVGLSGAATVLFDNLLSEMKDVP